MTWNSSKKHIFIFFVYFHLCILLLISREWFHNFASCRSKPADHRFRKRNEAVHIGPQGYDSDSSITPIVESVNKLKRKRGTQHSRGLTTTIHIVSFLIFSKEDLICFPLKLERPECVFHGQANRESCKKAANVFLFASV